MSLPSDFFGRILFILQKYGVSFLNGAGKTMALALVGTLIGCIIGFAVGIVQTIPVDKKDNPVKRGVLGLIKLILNIYVEVFRGTPMMVQAMFIYYGSSVLFGFNMSQTFAAYFIISINTGAYMAETVRGGILSIDPGQTEGAKAIGMNHIQTMVNVIMPQALRNIMPQIGNNLIINIKDSSVMFIISFTEFFAAHRGAVGATYLYFPSATIEMVGYLTMTLIASFILHWVEKRMDGNSDYELAKTDPLTMAAGTYSHPDRGTPFDERSKEYRDRVRQELQHGRTRGDR